MRFLYAYIQAIFHHRTEPEVLHVQNLRSLLVLHAIEIKLHIVHVQKLIT